MEHDWIVMNGYRIDKKYLFSLKTPFDKLIEEDSIELDKYTLFKTRYLFSNNGILFDMKFNHQEKLYISKDRVPIYYYVNQDGETKIKSVQDIYDETFNDGQFGFNNHYIFFKQLC